jgi:hypothetical protein
MTKKEQRQFVYSLYNKCHLVIKKCETDEHYKVALKYCELAIKKVKSFKNNDFIFYINCFNDLIKHCKLNFGPKVC